MRASALCQWRKHRLCQALLRLVAVGILCAGPLRAQADWRLLGTFDEATVATQTTTTGPLRVRATRTLPIDCAAVVAALQDVPSFSRWVEFTGWDVVVDERAGGGALTMHGQHGMPFPFSPRDYVVDYVAARSSTQFTLTARSSDRGPKAANGTVRLRVHSTWAVTFAAELAGLPRCPVSYEYDGDLGGNFPAFLLEGAFKEEGPKLLASLLTEARRREAKP